MKTKLKFTDIKGMLRREEMKVIVGGDPYNGQNSSSGGGGSPGFLAGTTLAGAQNANLGLTIAPGTNYSTSYNYGAGATGAYGIGTTPTNTTMTTYSNGGNTSPSTSTPGYGRP
jgi:hypothetical protein